MFLKKYFFQELPWLYNCRTSQLVSSNLDVYISKVTSKLMPMVMTEMTNMLKDEEYNGKKAYTIQNLWMICTMVFGVVWTTKINCQLMNGWFRTHTCSWLRL